MADCGWLIEASIDHSHQPSKTKILVRVFGIDAYQSRIGKVACSSGERRWEMLALRDVEDDDEERHGCGVTRAPPRGPRIRVRSRVHDARSVGRVGSLVGLAHVRGELG